MTKTQRIHDKSPSGITSTFVALNYSLTFKSSNNTNKLVINGKKMPPPSKRITLNQKGLKVIKASIVYHHKKGDQTIEVMRINHIKSFQEVRIHTEQLLYPGNYTINLEFKTDNNEQLDMLDQSGTWETMSWRSAFPSIDQPDARKLAKVEVTKKS
jgi:hypothetical protein